MNQNHKHCLHTEDIPEWSFKKDILSSISSRSTYSSFFPTAVGVNVIQSASVTAILKANRWRHIGYVKISSNSRQSAAATEHAEFWVSLQVPFPIQLADTVDVPAFHSVAHALLWPVSKQKRLQLFSFSMCSYIIVRPASVTPPSLLRKRSYFLWKCQFFSKCSNAVWKHGDLMEMPFSLLISFLSICISTFILPLSLCHSFFTPSLAFSLSIALSLSNFLPSSFPHYILLSNLLKCLLQGYFSSMEIIE